MSPRLHVVRRTLGLSAGSPSPALKSLALTYAEGGSPFTVCPRDQSLDHPMTVGPGQRGAATPTVYGVINMLQEPAIKTIVVVGDGSAHAPPVAAPVASFAANPDAEVHLIDMAAPPSTRASAGGRSLARCLSGRGGSLLVDFLAGKRVARAVIR